MVLETGASTQPAGHFGIEAEPWAPLHGEGSP